jgi:hypothetical protein
MSDVRKPITFGQQIAQNKGMVISWLLGTFLFVVGVVCIVVFFTWNSTRPEESWKVTTGLVGLGLIVLSFIAKIPFYVKKQRYKRQREIHFEIARQKDRQEELNRIRKSMTPAEWELYQVQLENQRLLREIKNKPTSSGNNSGTGPRAVYGIVTDPFD